MHHCGKVPNACPPAQLRNSIATPVIGSNSTMYDAKRPKTTNQMSLIHCRWFLVDGKPSPAAEEPLSPHRSPRSRASTCRCNAESTYRAYHRCTQGRNTSFAVYGLRLKPIRGTVILHVPIANKASVHLSCKSGWPWQPPPHNSQSSNNINGLDIAKTSGSCISATGT
jgi:hypothetical protein